MTPAQKQVQRAKSAPHSWTVVLTESREWGSGRAEGGRCDQLGVHSCFTRDQTTRHLDDYRCTLLCGIMRGSFQETVSRKTAKNTAKHRGGGESSMVVTTLINITKKTPKQQTCAY